MPKIFKDILELSRKARSTKNREKSYKPTATIR